MDWTAFVTGDPNLFVCLCNVYDFIHAFRSGSVDLDVLRCAALPKEYAGPDYSVATKPIMPVSIIEPRSGVRSHVAEHKVTS
jgi:hypothetical protein